jgi:hypothetical protein
LWSPPGVPDGPAENKPNSLQSTKTANYNSLEERALLYGSSFLIFTPFMLPVRPTMGVMFPPGLISMNNYITSFGYLSKCLAFQ